MMSQEEAFSYGEGNGYQIIELPYDGLALSMTIVLPEEERFTEISQEMSLEWLEGAAENLTPGTQVALKLPKFKFHWGSQSLVDALKALGMLDAFDGSVADFSGINPSAPLFITEVVHQAFIGVDEYGTEAAAATAVIIGENGLPPAPVSMTVDRPFFFFIRDTTGIILFVGQVMDPTVE